MCLVRPKSMKSMRRRRDPRALAPGAAVRGRTQSLQITHHTGVLGTCSRTARRPGVLEECIEHSKHSVTSQ